MDAEEFITDKETERLLVSFDGSVVGNVKDLKSLKEGKDTVTLSFGAAIPLPCDEIRAVSKASKLSDLQPAVEVRSVRPSPSANTFRWRTEALITPSIVA